MPTLVERLNGSYRNLAGVVVVSPKILKEAADRIEFLEAALATVRDDMHLTQMTSNPNDSGAYVLGREAERAVLAFKREAS